MATDAADAVVEHRPAIGAACQRPLGPQRPACCAHAATIRSWLAAE